MITKSKLDCSIPIEDSSPLKGNVDLPRNKVYTLVIDYPLDNPAKFQIKTGIKGMSSIQVIDKIIKSYHKVYEQNIHGVWGHDIGDLMLVTVYVDHKKKLITLDVDS